MENCKVINGFENYLIFRDGRILNRTRKKFLSIKIGKTGYHRVDLYNLGKNKTFNVHRLLAKAFIPNYENKPCVNHIDGIKSNNCIDNLEWVTHKENIQHAFKNNLIVMPSKEKHYQKKLSIKLVSEIRNCNGISQRKIAKIFNVSQSTIHEIKTNKIWVCKA
jgi:DNA-binding transcriptional regulator YiaG